MAKYKVVEIFYSIQGEGYWSKHPAVFIRLAGCNLKCHFCDTEFDTYKEMEAKEIIEEVKALGGNCKFVVITGGEPTLHDLTHLTGLLRRNHYYIAIETNGTNEIKGFVNWITVSPKLIDKELKIIQGNELKVVYEGQDLKQYEDPKYHGFRYFYLQPMSRVNEKEVIEITLDNFKNNTYSRNWQLSLQIQKMIDVR